MLKKINIKNKLVFLFFFGVLFLIFLIRYINLYLNPSKAGASAATFSLLPNNFNLDLNQIQEVQLLAQFQNGSSSEKIDYLKLALVFPNEKLELADYIDTTSSGLNRQIRVDGQIAANSSGQIIIEIGALTPGSGPSTDNPIQVAKIKFKGKSSGSGEINIKDIQVVNNASAEITQLTRNNINFSVFTKKCTDNSECGANASCINSYCDCNSGYYNCDGNWDNGCESQNICPTPTPTEFIPGTGSAILNLKLKFQGIMKQPQDADKKTMKIKVKLGGGMIPEPISTEAVFNLTQNRNSDSDPFIWEGTVNLPSQVVTPGSDYYILIKGPKHIQKRICDNKPTESSPGSYRCFSGKIQLQNEINNLDFSGIYLLSGDIPVSGGQDGVVNSLDTSYIRNNLGKNNPEVLAIADLNLDGKIDSQDWSLVIAALSVRADEE